MPRLFFGNFDFEHSLGNNPLHQLPEKLLRIYAKLTMSLLPLMNAGDYIWIPQLLLDLPDEEVTPGESWQEMIQQAGVIAVNQVDQISKEQTINFVPWGWTTKLVQWAKKQGWQIHHPAMKSVEWANSRATSFGYEQQWRSAPLECVELMQVENLDQALKTLSADAKWVIKAEFSMSARERMIGQGCEVPLATMNWLKKRLKNNGRIFFEPWLDAISEMSFHYEISPAGEVDYLGKTELITDDFGRYIKNRVIEESSEYDWSFSRSQTEKFASECTKQGYFGPLSIDAMQYRSADGTNHQRPLQDVNARYSMGRCELERSCKKSHS